MVKTQVGLRLDDALLDRLDRIANELSRRASGVSVARADAARGALERGLPVFEAELGLAPLDPSTKAKKGTKKSAPKA